MMMNNNVNMMGGVNPMMGMGGGMGGNMMQQQPKMMNQFGQSGGISSRKNQQAVQKDDPFAKLGL